MIKRLIFLGLIEAAKSAISYAAIVWLKSRTKDELDIVFTSERGGSYHRKDCRYVSENSSPIAVEVAERKGYKPCHLCKPDK